MNIRRKMFINTPIHLYIAESTLENRCEGKATRQELRRSARHEACHYGACASY